MKFRLIHITFFCTLFLIGWNFNLSIPTVSAQGGTIYSVKSGLTVGNQRWSNYNRRPLMKYHLAAAIESYSPENTSAIFLQGGYHLKGSAIRFNRTISPTTGQEFPGRTDEFRFHNLSLLVGAKQKFEIFDDSRLYYLVGVRGDYNLKADFDRSFYEGVKDQINKFTFGVTVGGGLEIPLSHHLGIFFELTVAPDFSNQIYIPSHRNFRDPNRMNPEQKVINVAIELSVGMRFLHEVIYH